MARQTNTTAKAVKNAKESKRKAVAEGLAGMKLLGEIITWNAKSDSTHKHTDVLQALDAAGIDKDIAKELLPRFAFARASKKLSEERVIDVLREEGEHITFQFTRKSFDQSGEEWTYAKETLLVLDKATGKIECSNQNLRELAQRELDKAMEERTTNDITKIVQRVFEKQADLFSLRDQGGVYFVPQEHCQFLTQVESFLVALGGRISRFPVPAGTQYGDRAVQDAVAGSLQQLIDDHMLAVNQFSINTRKDTIEHAAEKIKATRTKIEAYANYLADRSKELLANVDAANQKLLGQVNVLADLRANSAPVAGENRNILFGHATTAVIRWMGKQNWKFKDVRESLNRMGVQVAEATIRAQLLAGRKGQRGEPAELTAEQIATLSGETVEPPKKSGKKSGKKVAATAA